VAERRNYGVGSAATDALTQGSRRRQNNFLPSFDAAAYYANAAAILRLQNAGKYVHNTIEWLLGSERVDSENGWPREKALSEVSRRGGRFVWFIDLGRGVSIMPSNPSKMCLLFKDTARLYGKYAWERKQRSRY
jgi:hypothetical protein